MNTASALFLAIIGLPLLANIGSIFWQTLRERPFLVIYLPIAARTATLFRLLGISSVALLAFDQLVTHYLKPDIISLIILSGFALINGLSVYYRWRRPLGIDKLQI